MTRIKTLELSVVCMIQLFLLTSCGAPEQVSYLQDLQRGVPMEVQQPQHLTLKPGDRLRIVVFSRDRELAAMFNLTGIGTNGYTGGNVSGGYMGNGQGLSYTVDPEGYVEIPTLGRVLVEGLTRLEVAERVKDKLIETQLLLDPTVIVDYAGLSFSVLGEVGRKGRIEIPTDQITILEALSLAGDLTIEGQRENVLVLRTENGVQNAYTIDLTNTASVYESPVYYLQQNDLIYVEPNAKRRAQSDINATTFRTFSFWVSIPTLIVSLLSLITRFIPITPGN